MDISMKSWYCLHKSLPYSLNHLRLHSCSKIDRKKLRKIVLKRIENRAKHYPVSFMIPVANDVLNARVTLTEGLTTLLKVMPMRSCKFCPELSVGKEGHQIRTCPGFKRVGKTEAHQWLDAKLDDILVPVEAFHLKSMFQDVIRHDQRFDFDRVPAVLELCHQAGAEVPMEDGRLDKHRASCACDENKCADEPVPLEDPSLIAQRTLESWERLRAGIQRLLLIYPARVCEHCKEVHVGPSGHKARLCGVFKFEGWRGKHWWKKAGVDDLVPPMVVWHRRSQDPPVLLDAGRSFYGHAPAVVELCYHAGARVPSKYHCMMKEHGMPAE